MDRFDSLQKFTNSIFNSTDTINSISCNNADTISIDSFALEAEIQQNWREGINDLQTLPRKVSNLHTSVLFCRGKSAVGEASLQAYFSMVKAVGAASPRHVGRSLGITEADLEYINNSPSYDPCDVILKVFAQSEAASLDKILNVLLRMERYDLLNMVKNSLNKLSKFFTSNDSGIQSDIESRHKVLHSYQKAENELNNVPPGLKKKYTSGKGPNQPIIRLPAKKTEVATDNNSIIFFITHAEDGKAAVLDIKSMVETWDDMPEITVLTLNDKREEVFQNPETYIRQYFEKATIIIPILTRGYLEEIKSHNPTVPNTSDNLDCRYVNFFYNLIINTYVHANGCLNKKVRSVVPKENTSIEFLRNISLYPDLMPWTSMSNFEKQFKAFLKRMLSN